jgi:hypothetical protein
MTQGVLHVPPDAPGAVATGAYRDSGMPAVLPSSRPYAQDVLWTFLFPTKIGDLLTFVAIWITLLVANMFMFVGGFGLIGLLAFGFYVLLIGWYCAFRFSVIESAAAGEDHLPHMDFSEGWIGDALGSMVRWVVSWVVVMAPAFLYRSYYYSTLAPNPAPAGGGMMPSTPSWVGDLAGAAGGVPGILALPPDGLDLFKILVLLGLFLWPFVVLCVGIGGVESLFRLDLMLATVFRTLGPYAVTVALMVGAAVIGYLIEEVAASRLAGGGAGAGGAGRQLASGFFLSVVSLGITIYFDIVLMRLIGLYYHHFKDKFAWDWG